MTGHGENPALLILAAGEGSRMRSRTPKLLHPVCDRSILRHIVRMGQELGAKPIVIVDVAEYWRPFLALIEHVIAERFATAAARGLYTMVDRVDEVIPAILAAPGPRGAGGG